jgi:hypothetical protein
MSQVYTPAATREKGLLGANCCGTTSGAALARGAADHGPFGLACAHCGAEALEITAFQRTRKGIFGRRRSDLTQSTAMAGRCAYRMLIPLSFRSCHPVQAQKRNDRFASWSNVERIDDDVGVA